MFVIKEQNSEDSKRSTQMVHAFIILCQNAAGNRILKSLKTAKGGILTGVFDIPDVSEYVHICH